MTREAMRSMARWRLGSLEQGSRCLLSSRDKQIFSELRTGSYC